MKRTFGSFTAALLAVFLMQAEPSAAASVTVVPPGNIHSKQPSIPGASSKRTAEGKTTFDAKYQKVFELLKNDKRLLSKIKSTAKRYNIAPIHIIGAIVGEHTYNVDAYDRLQSYYIKAAAYAGDAFRFAYDGERISDFIARPEFEKCADIKGAYELWNCRERIWESTFRGKKVDGTKFPNDRFSAVFFQPFYAGQTFGLGQINPLTALELSDLVHDKSGYSRLDENDAAGVYEAIMNPDISLAFVAAAVRKAIDEYRDIAGLDISKNPGITATLFNLGNTRQRASALAAKNKRRSQKLMPEENYYGWLINEKLDELESLL